ncbi:MAG: hypothetical protein HY974_03035, partial [Candidatus Kerfeldbacteria bacterium]|nr:hypothetical protein [Candidatus Kerfeldbacteria bacterium]
KFGDRRGGEVRTPVDTWYLSDLKKLRRARIIPVGWELAASAFPGSTLQQVIGTKSQDYKDGFNSVGGDGQCGTTDGSSPYCGLIDPNWVLRAPPEQCRIQAYGQLLEPEGANRQKTCVDVQHCVAEREDGSCQAWGYCTKEKNIWRFSGESCEFPEGSGYSPYATCKAFTNSNGDELAYLTNSLSNYSGYGDSTCSGVIGCRWYGTSLDPNLTSNDPARYSVTGTQAKVNTQDFITPSTPSQSLDNGDFESGTTGWDTSAAGAGTGITSNPTWVHAGSQALRIVKGGGNSSVSQYLGQLKGGTKYMVSAWFKSNVRPDLRAQLYFGDAVFDGVNDGVSTNGVVSDAWQQLMVEYTPTSDANFYIFLYASRDFGGSAGDDVVFDDVQLWDSFSNPPRLYLRNLDSQTYQCNSQSEGCRQFLRLRDINYSAVESAAGSNPVAKVVNKVTASEGDTYGAYATAESLTLREAPPYLGVCRDTNPTNDTPECKNYLASCSASEVGCELYAPSDGSPAVPAQIGPENVCPTECVGLNTYQQVGTFFEQTPLQPSVNFIPTSAQKCSAESVGCEEFTNIEAGEKLEYYSELRQCIKPGEGDHTYYTWVGSDLTGYQLKTWQLKASGSAPSAAPATTDDSGGKDLCGSVDHKDFQKADSATSPDCKQFYDVTGNIHYRYATKTITASATCIQYRRTGGTEQNCTDSGGQWLGTS